MLETLKAGETHRFEYKVPATKTVPHLYPEAIEFTTMPTVFATGFMVGLMEWAAIQLLASHMEPGEGSLGTHIDVSHVAATVPGQIVTVDVEVTAVEGRKVSFNVVARDDLDKIGEGRHERIVVRWDKFEAKVNAKAKVARVRPVTRRKI
ncbi:MAG: thioesterase family protein [Hyphomicrobiaceae bacterium]|nr:thioesterase family protein [Hyphomicrobiaceae bacterium]